MCKISNLKKYILNLSSNHNFNLVGKGTKTMKNLHYLTFILLVVGGLNWLLVGLFQWDVGEIFGGQDALISRIVYILVGLSAVYEIIRARS